MGSRKDGAGQQAARRTIMGHPLSHENTARPSPKKGRNSKGGVCGPDKTQDAQGRGHRHVECGCKCHEGVGWPEEAGGADCRFSRTLGSVSITHGTPSSLTVPTDANKPGPALPQWRCRSRPRTLAPPTQTPILHCALALPLTSSPTGPTTSTHSGPDGLESVFKQLQALTQSALMTARAKSLRCISMTSPAHTRWCVARRAPHRPRFGLSLFTPTTQFSSVALCSLSTTLLGMSPGCLY